MKLTAYKNNKNKDQGVGAWVSKISEARTLGQ